MAIGAGLATLTGYPFEVRHSDCARERALAAAELAADAYGYFDRLFSGAAPDVALVVAGQTDWESAQPYGLPFFTDDAGGIRPGVVVIPAGAGGFWTEMVAELRAASPRGHGQLRLTYPDGAGGVDLRPFFELVTVHELGHAFEVLGDLRFPTSWLSEIFANLAMHAFVASRRPERLETLEVLPRLGAGSRRLAARMRAGGHSTLEQLDAHYTGGENPMSPLNYAWYQYRWQRLAARLFDAEGEDVLVRFWECFRAIDRPVADPPTARSLAPLLRAEVSPILGRAVREWRSALSA